MRPSGHVGDGGVAGPRKVESRKIAPAILSWCDTSTPRYLPIVDPPQGVTEEVYLLEARFLQGITYDQVELLLLVRD
jgi:hypothetical protein